MDIKRRIVSEAVGTAGLLVAVVGSGIAVSRIAQSEAVALAVHACVVGAALVTLICALERWSTHFNPAVTIALWAGRLIKGREALLLIAGQCGGAIVGVAVADIMFGEPVFALGTTARTGAGLWLGELVATFGLLLVILGARGRGEQMPYLVGAYVAGAIWFTSSAAFANPAVALSRMFTDTWCGIRPSDVPPFVFAELFGALVAVVLLRWLTAVDSSSASAR